MRAAGTKSSLMKALKEETKVNIVPYLPQEERKTAVVVDAMHNIWHGASKGMKHLEILQGESCEIF